MTVATTRNAGTYIGVLGYAHLNARNPAQSVRQRRLGRQAAELVLRKFTNQAAYTSRRTIIPTNASHAIAPLGNTIGAPTLASTLNA